MGHTARCVAIINALVSNNNTVFFAGNAQQNCFIEKDFPQIKTVLLQGYNIQLDSKKSTYFQMALQSPKFAKAIKAENKWLHNFCANNKVDFIISDNRYGFYHTTIPSVIITHQLSMQLPKFKTIVNKQIAKKVECFKACWIPDFKNHLLTGELSKSKLKIPVHFINPLNRFQNLVLPEKYQLLVILSGPEPERTNFLNYALAFVKNKNYRVAFVGAKVKNNSSFENPTTKELARLIAQSNTVFSRAGYTTIMEMVSLNKKAILIPTVGQFEQEYLATHVKHPTISFVKLGDLESVVF